MFGDFKNIITFAVAIGKKDCDADLFKQMKIVVKFLVW